MVMLEFDMLQISVLSGTELLSCKESELRGEIWNSESGEFVL